MSTDILFVNVFEEDTVASQMISDYDLLALSVVDNEGKLVGIVTVDDAVDLVIEEDTEDMLHLGAVEKYIDYLRSNPFTVARQRIIWLFVLVAMGFLSGWVLERYKDVLDAVVSLVFFIPLLCAAGGNAGTQTSTVVIRGLATGEIDFADIWKVFSKEIFIGILMGCIMGIASALRAFFVSNSDYRLSIVVGCTMVFVVILANAMGALFPIILKRLKMDPAIMCGPFIASIVDVCCILAYLEIARLVYY